MTDSSTPVPRENSVAFVVVSCDKYADLWEPFFHFLKKNWPDCPYRLYLVTNHLDCPEPGVSVIKIGDDRSYADNLRTAISQLAEPWVILWLEDVFISKPVDTNRLNRIVTGAQSSSAGYLKLSPDLPLSYEGSRNDDYAALPKGIRYRSAVGLSLYQVRILDKLLIPGATAWELDRSDVSDQLDEPFFALTPRGASPPPLIWTHGVIKGRWCWPAVRLLKREGFELALTGREILGWRDVLYLRLFKIHNWLFRTFRLYWR